MCWPLNCFQSNCDWALALRDDGGRGQHGGGCLKQVAATDHDGLSSNIAVKHTGGGVGAEVRDPF